MKAMLMSTKVHLSSAKSKKAKRSIKKRYKKSREDGRSPKRT